MRLTDVAAGRVRGLGGALLAALLVAVVASGCGPSEPPPPDAALEGLKADIDTISKKTQEDPYGRIDGFQIGPEATDESGRMHQVGRQFMNSVFEVRNAYLAELDAIGWDDILEPDRLKADPGMADGRRMIRQAREALARAEAQTLAAYENFPALVESARLSARNKRDMLRGFEESKPRGLVEARDSFALESEILDQFEAMVDLLGRVPWDVEQSQIMFHADADVEAFNAHFDRIVALTERQQARQQAALDGAKTKLSESP